MGAPPGGWVGAPPGGWVGAPPGGWVGAPLQKASAQNTNLIIWQDFHIHIHIPWMASIYLCGRQSGVGARLI